MLKRLLWGMLAACLMCAPAFATTYTPCQAYSLPVPGDPAVANIWGTILNTNTSLIDTGMGGSTSLSVAGSSNVVLTSSNGAPDQSRSAYYNFTGALTGNIDVLLGQNRCGRAVVHNGTTGAFTLSVGNDNGAGTPAGTVVAIPQGETATVFFDGTNAVIANTPGGIGALTSTTGVPASRTITAGTGLTGGGDLSANRSLSLASISTGKMLANLSGGVAAPIAIDIPTLYVQSFSSSGSFTVPAGATVNTVFKFTVIGGGGGGGGTGSPSAFSFGAGGGGSGGAIVGYFFGFTPSSSVTITVGAGGGGGNSSGGNGSAGATSKVTYSAVDFLTATGGGGGTGSSSNGTSAAGGAPGTGATTSSSTSYALSASGGGVGIGAPSGASALSGFGGSNPFGAGGQQRDTSGSGLAGVAGGIGAGGSGASSRTLSFAGGAGGNGAVIVEWIL